MKENYYEEIKDSLLNNEVYKRVKEYSKNRSDLDTYYKVGEILAKAGKHYGEGIIKEYSNMLTRELGRKYSVSNLKRMRQFYWLIEKGVALQHLLSWNHYIALIPINDVNEINYYIKLSVNMNYSYRKLRDVIKSNEYERLPLETKNKLLRNDNTTIKDLVPNPILIISGNNREIVNEKVLQQIILENIVSFMEQLGNGYSFIKNEYKIKLDDRYYYIDLLLFNYKFNSFIVVELKVTELKKEHIGQIHVYMNYIDKNVKEINQDKTIGIIICKKDNKFVMEYCSDERILSREYKLI